MTNQSGFPRRARSLSIRAGLFCILLAFALHPAGAMRALLVGGGPEPDHNQVAIESNVRYLMRLLPPDSQPIVLFADGSKSSKSVLYEQSKTVPANERLLALILTGHSSDGTAEAYRAPELSKMDGASAKADIEEAFKRLRAASGQDNSPLLLYFTGHGGMGQDHDLDNNVFALWNDEPFTVKDLAGQIAKLPPAQPVTLVMVQCFSGSFGNLLFKDGDPQGNPIDRDLAGFFATVRDHVAAGCTPAINEADYHDFTSYFFAALTGRDRLGRAVTGADYNHDGKVSMDEAFAYTLIHDASIDIPTCTSDVYLDRYVDMSDEDVYKSPYSQVLGWTTPAQKAALEGLSDQLKLTGEDRAAKLQDKLNTADNSDDPSPALLSAYRAFEKAGGEAQQDILTRWPGLRNPKSPRYATERAAALAYIDSHMNEGKLAALAQAESAFNKARDGEYQTAIQQARQMRFARLYKSVVLAHKLRADGDADVKRRFERLLVSEARTGLPETKTASAAEPVHVH